MTTQEIIERTNVILAEHFEIDVSSITPDAIIRQTLDLDSLRAMELIVVAKKQFVIMIPPRQLSYIVTFGDLYDYLYENVKER